MDLTRTIEPNSQQLNFDDVASQPVTVTITGVTAGSPEQPVNVELAEYPGRPWRPSKSMRRVLVAAWGRDSSAYVGQRITLYGDPEVTFGRDKVGGIRISHMSGLTQPLTVPLTVTRGKRRPFTVQPLPDAPVVTVEQAEAAEDEATLRDLWGQTNDPTVQAAIRARVELLRGEEVADD